MATIGNCNIMAPNPYPRIFFEMHAMTSSWAMELTKKVIIRATGLEKCDNEEK